MRNRQTSTLLSLLIHAAAALLMFTAATNPKAIIPSLRAGGGEVKLIEPYLGKRGGGGGGGTRSPLPASKGALPKAAARQFTPPQVELLNPEPRLIMEPAIVVAANTPLPVVNMTQLGDPNGLPGPPSAGRGKDGGIGDGAGGGVGPGKGLGYGPGEQYGSGGGAPQGGAKPRGIATPAALIWKIEPEYSDEARRAKVQGTVLLYLEVDAEGKPCNIRVQQGLGLGLDEKAIQAVQRWRFRPGRRNGRPIPTAAAVEVNFRLL
jgi:periplasmic protein TonB